MITWFEAPKEGLSPGGKIEFQTLTATENKTYSEDGVAYTSVTVDVEGGGGSSDFSTAEVTLINSGSGTYFMAYNITLFDQEANTLSITSRQVDNQYRFKTPIPTGGTSYFIVEFDDYDFDTPPVITGDIVLGSDGFEVSGDGTITIKGTGMLG